MKSDDAAPPASPGKEVAEAKLSEAKLLLVTIESVMQETIEIEPRTGFELCFNGLEPPTSRTIHMHLRNEYPQGITNRIHGEILFGPRVPQTWIITIEPRKIEFRKAACMRWTGEGGRWQGELLRVW